MQAGVLGTRFAMEVYLTVAALIGGLALSLAMVWLERRPRRDLNPRLLPTTPFMFVGVLLFILAVVHTLSLLGVAHTPAWR
jgi:hypothetical protein